MILIDTSAWIDHFRLQDEVVQSVLDRDEAVTHPFVIGELALGRLQNRAEILSELLELPSTLVAAPTDVLALIETAGLVASGVGYVDAHLIASCKLDRRVRLLTRDKRLSRAARTIIEVVDP